MGGAAAGLDVAGELQRRTHLARDGVARLVPALVVFRQDRAQQVQPLLPGGAGEGWEGQPGRRHGAVDVGRAADGDLGERLLGRRVDDVKQGGLDRVDPLAVDVELFLVLHGEIPSGSADAPWQGPPDLRRSLYIGEYNEGKEHRDRGISGKRTQQGPPFARARALRQGWRLCGARRRHALPYRLCHRWPALLHADSVLAGRRPSLLARLVG